LVGDLCLSEKYEINGTNSFALGGTSFIEDPRRWVEQAAAANGGVFRTDALGRVRPFGYGGT